MSTTTLNEQTVLDALRQVKYPGFSRDIVSFGFVKDLEVGGGNVSFRLEIMTESPRGRRRDPARRDREAALARRASTSVTISSTCRPRRPSAPARPGRAPPAGEILKDVRFKVAVASGKGGVGKSTVTANLALALSKLGYEVGLMDSDIYGPSQQMMMGITRSRS